MNRSKRPHIPKDLSIHSIIHQSIVNKASNKDSSSIQKLNLLDRGFKDGFPPRTQV